MASPIWFTHSGQELHIETNATLVVHNTSYEHWPHGRHIISASNLFDLAITGASSLPYSDSFGANRTIRVWRRATENSP